jgi:hypothetical protein
MWVAQGREMAHLGRHAIVIGASMGGLLAGRALAGLSQYLILTRGPRLFESAAL